MNFVGFAKEIGQTMEVALEDIILATSLMKKSQRRGIGD